MTNTILYFIIMLGILIFIHELGHFVVAKLSGVGVEKFSLGFGPRLIGIKRGETEYRISLVPFGGYVKMWGESYNVEEEVDRALKEGEELSFAERESRIEEHREKSFLLKPLSRRMAIVGAGPFMNLMLAFIIFPVIFMIGVEVPAYRERPPVIDYVARGTPAYEAGVRGGDLVEEFNGIPVATWEEFEMEMALAGEGEKTFRLRRGGDAFTASFHVGGVDGMAADMGGAYPPMPPLIGGVMPGDPADAAGLRAGDLIKAIDKRPVTNWVELHEAAQEAGKEGRELSLRVSRDGETFTAVMTPVYNAKSEAYLIGVLLDGGESVTRRFGLVESVKLGFSRAVGLTVMTVKFLKGLVVGSYSIKNLGGPITIAQFAGRAAESGLVPFLGMLAFLSLQLGVINLMPIPVLDGGFILFFAIEGIKGRPVSERVMGMAQNIGLVLLLGLMAVVTWNDIMRVSGDIADYFTKYFG